MKRHRLIRVGFPLLLCLVLVGCGQDQGVKLEAVKGKVLQGGAPVAGVLVTFVPDGSRVEVVELRPSAITDAQGEFVLMTNAKPGAPEGGYRVTISTDVPPGADGQTAIAPTLVLDPQLTNPNTTTLSSQVPAESYSFDLPQ